MEIKPYLDQSTISALLAAVTCLTGIMGARIISHLRPPVQGALASGMAAGVTSALSTVVAHETPLSQKLKEHFPINQMDFRILILMTTLFLSSAILTPLVSRYLLKTPLTLFGYMTYPPIVVACATVAHLKFFRS